MKIELIPLEKMIFDGKEICFSAKKEDIIKLLGEPESKHENYGGKSWSHYYPEFGCEYNENGELISIEFLCGHSGSLKPYIYGVSAFDISRKELFKILKEHNNGKIDEESEDSYGFIEISVGIWKDSANEDDDYWTTILIGKKNYYN